jgi:hypothetical protein
VTTFICTVASQTQQKFSRVTPLFIAAKSFFNARFDGFLYCLSESNTFYSAIPTFFSFLKYLEIYIAPLYLHYISLFCVPSACFPIKNSAGRFYFQDALVWKSAAAPKTWKKESRQETGATLKFSGFG